MDAKAPTLVVPIFCAPKKAPCPGPARILGNSGSFTRLAPEGVFSYTNFRDTSLFLRP